MTSSDMPLFGRGADAGGFADAAAPCCPAGEAVCELGGRNAPARVPVPGRTVSPASRRDTEPARTDAPRCSAGSANPRKGGQQRCGVSPLDAGRRLPMSPDPLRRSTEEIFWSFAQELARTHDRGARLSRLRRGHYPDRHGWCGHPEHECRWQRYPCPQVRLADLVDQLATQQRHPICMWRGRLLETQLRDPSGNL